MEKYTCTHCGHHFESEPQESLICPNCFWSTSVKKGEPVSVPPRPEKSSVQTPSKPSRIWFWPGGVALGLLLVGISYFAVNHLKKQDEILKTIAVKNAEVISAEAPELALSAEEQAVLNQKITSSPVGELSPSEKEILEQKIPLLSRLPQGLPTPPWGEKQFETFLKEQELQYKIPLERSYRKKLKQLFKTRYLPAVQSFEAKDWLKARDEWIRSLAFPVYQNDVRKHRGVVLTMLQSYINDTLSKIGMMNAFLTEGDFFATEEKVRSSYAALGELLQKQFWEEAGAAILELDKLIEGLGNAAPPVSPPPLPKETGLIDTDIRAVLLEQAAPVNPGLRDWEALRQDLAAKEKVVQSRLPSAREAMQAKYDEALSQIANHRWREAKELLQQIDFPEELKKDAESKIEVLNKLVRDDQSGVRPRQ